MTIFSFLPKNCENLIFDFASIDWKKRFTFNVLPFLKSTHQIREYNGTPCFRCYINNAINYRNNCPVCSWIEDGHIRDVSFTEIMNTDTSSFMINLAKILNINSYERFILWLDHQNKCTGLTYKVQFIYNNRH